MTTRMRWISRESTGVLYPYEVIAERLYTTGERVLMCRWLEEHVASADRMLWLGPALRSDLAFAFRRKADRDKFIERFQNAERPRWALAFEQQ